ncbi:cyclopropane fatty-acyl-phospholipid synthase-like methyltransferase [Algoriphagus sp. 4150]|uniref:class I SAM-dependent methyltransferase n=1 Tax=Algoriphagus sp. 4150 TaxID=2817756 RepID=UPI00285FE5F4|nr:class I SAM-dependent methyltransferase [Algoriphagus sp. 4150]MDR7129201.1 cyclopropane fatty-acyl-phospholipid synthase-like methyltransferase [Algoriphagus sp. 4150]
MEEDKNKFFSFYDQFAENQDKPGINSRHLNILDKVKDAGLSANHSILEVGCGIGILSHLLAKQVKEGEVFAVDISPESIKKAKTLWKDQVNLKFEVSDMHDFDKLGKTFDFFVFPDIMEHISMDQYDHLFRNINKHAHQDSVIFIHIPSPRYLQWMIENDPQKLQLIEQPLDSGDLIKSITSNGFYLEKMETYPIFFEEKDYQYFVFRASKALVNSTPRKKWEILKERISIRIRHGIIN